ncbi:MAG TPA: hypothetical protein VNT02_07190 [Burkholderiales bacterium]|nr:hypothetical protein [Burkholderiales bacterium]
MTPSDASRQQLQRGVLTALLRIVSVRDAGARPLAIEFAAALERVRTEVENRSMPDELRQCFGKGLSLPILKLAAQNQVIGARRLRGLERDEIAAIDLRYRKEYLSLVMAVAEAALYADIDDGPYRRRSRSRFERAALDDIRKALQVDQKKVVI